MTDIAVLVTKTNFNTNINKIENKIPGTNSSVTKNDVNIKVTDVERRN